MSSETECTLENRELEVLADASSCAKDNYPNYDIFHIESSKYNKDGEEWCVRIFTDDGMGMEIICWEHEGKIKCDMQAEF